MALWLWLDPGTFSAGLLHRFVILNAATIATNLLPFTGLDGAWLLADAVGQPDLALRCRDAFVRLLTAALPALPAAGRTVSELRAAAAFRAQWRWRVPAHRLPPATLVHISAATLDGILADAAGPQTRAWQ